MAVRDFLTKLSNMAGILLVYGSAVGEVGYFLMFVSSGTLTVVDLLHTARK